MKKVLSLVLVLLMAVCMLTACGGSKEEPKEQSAGASVESLKTIGDIIEAAPEDLQSAVYEDKVVYAFKMGDNYYRAIAAISKEDSDAYMKVDFADEDYQEQQNKIVAPLKIDKIEDLSDQLISQEELDKLVGKTGKELVEDGWTYNGSYFLEEMQFELNKGPFVYMFVFDGSVDEKDYEDYDAEKGTRNMKVKSASFSALGDATNIEE